MICMMELRELELRHADFANERVIVYVVSNDDSLAAAANQRDFPHLRVVLDPDQKVAQALGMIHVGAGKQGDDTNAPTTLLTDSDGIVRWISRTPYIFDRPTPDRLLEEIGKL